MNTLTVADIFKNIAFYQARYQAILNNQTEYQTPVQDAVLEVWPAQSRVLYLGDLLQLWFSQKWLINSECTLLKKDQTFPQLFNPKIQRDDLYLCELHGNAVLGKSIAKVWSVSEQQLLEVELEGSLQYYCSYKTVKH